MQEYNLFAGCLTYWCVEREPSVTSASTATPSTTCASPASAGARTTSVSITSARASAVVRRVNQSDNTVALRNSNITSSPNLSSHSYVDRLLCSTAHFNFHYYQPHQPHQHPATNNHGDPDRGHHNNAAGGGARGDLSVLRPRSHVLCVEGLPQTPQTPPQSKRW